jgi:acetyltransferase-like isoleucine patch superfamily enzyme
MQDLYSEFERFDPSNEIHPTAIIHNCVTIGTGNKIGAYSVIGSDGEIRNCKEFKGCVIIGNDNVISELVTIQRPANEGAATVIGDRNLIMAHSHIGHDAQIGNGTEICTSTVIGGYANVNDGAKIKLHCVIRNRATIGRGALIGMGSVVTKDIANGAVAYGNPAKVVLSALLALVMFSGCSSDKPSKINVAVMAHNCVKQQLKAPSSSEFIDESVIQLNDSTYLVKGFVDSENGFGAMVQSSFLCAVTYRGESVICEDVLIF